MTQRSVESTINMVSTGGMQILLIKLAVFMQVLMVAMASRDLILVSFLGEEASRHSLKTCLEEVLTPSDVRAMKQTADELAALSREQQRAFLAYCQHLVRENFVRRFRSDDLNYLRPDEAAFSARFSPYVNERNVFDFDAELADAERHIAQNGNAKMIFFDLTLRITVLLKK